MQSLIINGYEEGLTTAEDNFDFCFTTFFPSIITMFVSFIKLTVRVSGKQYLRSSNKQLLEVNA
jgi:hypothetical protein